MPNSTTYLTIPAGQKLGTQVGYFENFVDFSKEPVAVGDTIDVLRLPKGAVLRHAGWIVHTTQGTVTFAMTVPGAGITIRTAVAMGANNTVTCVDVTEIAANRVLVADDTIRIAVAGATCSTAKVVFYAEYVVSDAFRD